MRAVHGTGAAASQAWPARTALLTEENPDHLIGLASCIADPAVASLLYARARLLTLRHRANEVDLQREVGRACARLAARVEEASRGLLSRQVVATKLAERLTPARDLAAQTLAAGLDEAVAQSWTAIAPAEVQWPRYDRMRFLERFALRQASPSDLVTVNAVLLMPEEDLRCVCLADVDGRDAWRREIASGEHEAKRAGGSLFNQLLRRRAREAMMNPARAQKVISDLSALAIDPARAAEPLARGLMVEVAPDVRVVDAASLRAILPSAAAQNAPALTSACKTDLQRWTRYYALR